VFGPFAGGILYAHFGFATPFLVAAGFQLITLVLTIVMLPESRTKRDDEERVGMNQILTTFHKPRLAPILWQKLAIALAMYGWFAVFALYLQRQLGFTLTQTDYLFSVFAIFNVIVNGFLIGRISARLGDRTMSNIGLACLVASFSLVAFVHALPLLTLMVLLSALGMAMTNTGITALISNAASDREQGTVLGTSSSLDSLSGILAPPISTGLLASYGPGYAGIESVLLSAVAFVMGLRAARGETERAISDEPSLSVASEIETAKALDG
jgi:MFS transporter, DHA1 family, tetracycline resistance protein